MKMRKSVKIHFVIVLVIILIGFIFLTNPVSGGISGETAISSPPPPPPPPPTGSAKCIGCTDAVKDQSRCKDDEKAIPAPANCARKKCGRKKFKCISKADADAPKIYDLSTEKQRDLFADCGGKSCPVENCPCLPTGSSLQVEDGVVVGLYGADGEYNPIENGQVTIGTTTYKVHTTLNNNRKGILQGITPRSVTPPPGALTPTQSTNSYNTDAKLRMKIGDEKLSGTVHHTVVDGQEHEFFQSTDGKWYYKKGDEWVGCSAGGDCGRDSDGNVISASKLISTGMAGQCADAEDKDACVQARRQESKDANNLIEGMKARQRFTFQEGVELGSSLWSLGTSFNLWSDADNPMAQLNEFFTNSKVGLILTGQWEKSICWETTDFNSPNDGIAFVPGTESVGAWVAGEYTVYSHPSVSDPDTIVTDYIYRITSVVNPSGLTINSGEANCQDIMQFSYILGQYGLDLDMDGHSQDDYIRILCDSKSYALTGQNAIVRYSQTLYGKICIQFQPMFLKPAFLNSLKAGRLCAPIVPAGFDYGTGCQWCPGVFTQPVGPAVGGTYGSTFGTGYGAAPTENRPGVVNPSSGPGD